MIHSLDQKIQAEKITRTALYAQIAEVQENLNEVDSTIEILEAQKTELEKTALADYIDKWIFETFCVAKQDELRYRRYVVFDKKATFTKIVTCGGNKDSDFEYVSGRGNTLEAWLSKNKFYSHALSSFYDRPEQWYQLSLKDQLESLGWTFSENGELSDTKW